ncbi:MAG: hypothetical protein EVA89_13930 [Sandaracinaceae bacterium]|nr:MAG: hypothetical protein EVA89_13930 [Sandaracinaceae bacterium]
MLRSLLVVTTAVVAASCGDADAADVDAGGERMDAATAASLESAGWILDCGSAPCPKAFDATDAAVACSWTGSPSAPLISIEVSKEGAGFSVGPLEVGSDMRLHVTGDSVARVWDDSLPFDESRQVHSASAPGPVDDCLLSERGTTWSNEGEAIGLSIHALGCASYFGLNADLIIHGCSVTP